MQSVETSAPVGHDTPRPTPPDPLHEFAALIDGHQRMVWRYLRLLGADAHEADDLMQDTFVCAAEGLRRGERLHAPAAFLRGVARNLLLGARRRTRRRPPTEPWLDAVDRHVEARPDVLSDDRLEALRRCLERLSGRARLAIETHHLEGASVEATARRLGIGIEGVRSLLRRTREVLRDCAIRQLGEQDR